MTLFVLKMLQELLLKKIMKQFKWQERLVGDNTHIRLHTHETAGVSVACYLAI